jgi:hypothetical protein
MEITAVGLVLGAGTVLAKVEGRRKGEGRLSLENEQRTVALLATAYERPIAPYLLTKIYRACALWNEGEKALAHIHLAHAGLPVCDLERALRLFAANQLLEQGVTQQELVEAQGFDPAWLPVLKYNPDQPRVPGGNGRESGRWTSEGTAEPGESDADGSALTQRPWALSHLSIPGFTIVSRQCRCHRGCSKADDRV